MTILILETSIQEATWKHKSKLDISERQNAAADSYEHYN
jgi:hypothetical protein